MTACDTVVSADLYIRDIQGVAEKKEALPTPVLMSLPIMSSASEECKKSQDKLIPIIKGYHDLPLTFKGCRTSGMDSYMDLELDTYLELDGNLTNRGLFSLVVQDKELAYDIYMTVHKNKLTGLSDAIFKATYHKPDLDKLTINLKINNDTRTSRKGLFGNSYIDGKAYDRLEEFSLDSRKSIDMKLSNVKVSVLMDSGATYIGQVLK